MANNGKLALLGFKAMSKKVDTYQQTNQELMIESLILPNYELEVPVL
jgi:hypothetical protein